MSHPQRPFTIKSQGFDPDAFFETWTQGEIQSPENDDLKTSVTKAFRLSENDSYVYHAIISTTLAQVQEAVQAGARNGLHAWYTDADESALPAPTQADIDAYCNVFASTTATDKAMVTLEKNAKKDSIRARVAQNLARQRVFPASIKIPKLKKPHVNPYLDFWTWSCRSLEWTGPDESTANVKQSHHVLPIFYHHFGCLCPSFESLETIKQLAAGRLVMDIGSGNGYWAYMLRRMGLTVDAVDNGDSRWRTVWIGDTLHVDGKKYLETKQGAKEAVLLLVYPQVTTSFTVSVLKAYQGDTICVAGTQNSNGFTAFADRTIDRYVSEELKEFEKLIQTPLPSFAGKDEALFVFQRKRA